MKPRRSPIVACLDYGGDSWNGLPSQLARMNAAELMKPSESSFVPWFCLKRRPETARMCHYFVLDTFMINDSKRLRVVGTNSEKMINGAENININFNFVEQLFVGACVLALF